MITGLSCQTGFTGLRGEGDVVGVRVASGGGGVGLGGRGTSRTVSPEEGVLQGAEGLYPARRR